MLDHPAVRHTPEPPSASPRADSSPQAPDQRATIFRIGDVLHQVTDASRQLREALSGAIGALDSLTAELRVEEGELPCQKPRT